MKKAIYIFIGITLLLTGKSFALEFQIIGPRAVGMGGANVAIVNDATAAHWNPAAYGFFGRERNDKKEDIYSSSSFEINVPVGVGVQAHGNMLSKVDDVKNYNFTDLASKAQAGELSADDIGDYINIVAELKDLTDGNPGLTIRANTSLNVRFKNFGISTIALANISASPISDLTNIGVGVAGSAIDKLIGTGTFTPSDSFSSTQRTDLNTRITALSNWDATETTSYLDKADQSLGNQIAGKTIVEATYDIAKAANDIDTGTSGSLNAANNNSNITYQGALVAEVPLSYGYAFNDHFSVGANLKYMRATTYYNSVKLSDINTSDSFKNFSDNSKESANIGLDFGLMYRRDLFSLGLVAKNLNSPSFTYDGPGDFKVDRQVRAGIAFHPFSAITIALDLDLTNNKTTLGSDYTSRQLAVGAELNFLKFMVFRVGTYRNLAENDIGQVFTAGFGIGLLGFKLDLASAVTTKNDTYNGDPIPSEIKVALMIAFEF